MVRKIIRHTDMRITLKHYTELRLSDEAAALEAMPAIGNAESDCERAVDVRATSTDDSKPRSAFAARRSPNVASGGKNRQNQQQSAPQKLAHCQEAQTPYNAAVGNDWQQVATHAQDDSEGSKKSGPLAQLASAPR